MKSKHYQLPLRKLLEFIIVCSGIDRLTSIKIGLGYARLKQINTENERERFFERYSKKQRFLFRQNVIWSLAFLLIKRPILTVMSISLAPIWLVLGAIRVITNYV